MTTTAKVIPGLVSRPQPAGNYAQALERYAALKQADSGRVNPVCATQLFTHNRRTQRAVLFIHGLTNCPRQFEDLGRRFFERGWNVVLGRLPYHGYRDRLDPDFAKLTAEDLAGLADHLVDVGAGLGEQVTLGGISGGAVAAAWAYQNRADLAQALLIAPSFEFLLVPGRFSRTVVRLARRLPNRFVWWDPRVKQNLKPDYTYPRFTTRALAEVLRLAHAVRDQAVGAAPAGGRAVLVTTASDNSVNNAASARVAAEWERHSGRVEQYEFPARLGLLHDMIDPNQSGQKVDQVYPKIIELAEVA